MIHKTYGLLLEFNTTDGVDSFLSMMLSSTGQTRAPSTSRSGLRFKGLSCAGESQRDKARSACPAGANCVPVNATTVQCNLGTLGAMGWILWQSAGPVSFQLGGGTVTVPGYLFWVAIGWGLLMWVFMWWRQGMTVAATAGVALLAGLFFGLAMAGYYRYHAKKHRLPDWPNYRGA